MLPVSSTTSPFHYMLDAEQRHARKLEASCRTELELEEASGFARIFALCNSAEELMAEKAEKRACNSFNVIADAAREHEAECIVAALAGPLGYDADEASRLADLFIRAGFGAAVCTPPGDRVGGDRSGPRHGTNRDLYDFMLSWRDLEPRVLAEGIVGLSFADALELADRSRMFFQLVDIAEGCKKGKYASKKETAELSPPRTISSPLRERVGVVRMRFHIPPSPIMERPASFTSAAAVIKQKNGNSSAGNTNREPLSQIEVLVARVESRNASADHFSDLAFAVHESSSLDSITLRLPKSELSDDDRSSAEVAGISVDMTPKELLAKALELNPHHGVSFLGLARILSGTETVRLANGTLLTKADAAVGAIALLPRSAAAYLALGVALASEPLRCVQLLDGSTMDCRKALTQTLELEPASAEAYLRLATVMGRTEEMKIGAAEQSVTKRSCYVSALRADPTVAAAYFGLGSLLGGNESVEVGFAVHPSGALSKRECFQRALQLNPRHALAKSSLAACLAPGEEVQLVDGSTVTSLHRHDPRSRAAALQPPPQAHSDAERKREGSDAASSRGSKAAEGGGSRSDRQTGATTVDHQLQAIARHDAVAKARLLQQRQLQDAAPAGGPVKRSTSANAPREQGGIAGRRRSILLVPYRSNSSHLAPQLSKPPRAPPPS